MRAIIKTAGKQYLVKEGDTIELNKSLDAPVGEKVEFKEVLAIGDDELKFGSPLVDKAKVTGKITKKDKEDKVTVYKFKRRKRYHKKTGHRQPLTEVKIIKITK